MENFGPFIWFLVIVGVVYAFAGIWRADEPCGEWDDDEAA